MERIVKSSSEQRGFSLIELLTVICIIAILMIVAVPAINSTRSGMEIERAASSLADEMALARQMAQAQNRSVEVRIIRLVGVGLPVQLGVQLWMGNGWDATPQPVTKLKRLPEAIAAAESLSPLFAAGGVSGMMPAGAVANSPYWGFRIRADGAVEAALDASNNYLTLVPVSKASSSGLPDNYAVLQINPMSAKVSIYRP